MATFSVTIRFLLIILGLLLSPGLSQSLIAITGSDFFPACAISCSTLRDIQEACSDSISTSTSTTATSDSQELHKSCFCQSPDLKALSTTGSGESNSPDSVCTSVCPTPEDQSALQKWYLDLCSVQSLDFAAPLPPPPPPSPPSSAGGELLKRSDATIAVRAAAPAESPNYSPYPVANNHTGNWFSTHWRWVVMIIVLAIGFTAFGFLLHFLKKRNARKKSAQHMAATITAAEAMSGGPSKLRLQSTSRLSGVAIGGGGSGGGTNGGRGTPASSSFAAGANGNNGRRSQTPAGPVETGVGRHDGWGPVSVPSPAPVSNRGWNRSGTKLHARPR